MRKLIRKSASFCLGIFIVPVAIIGQKPALEYSTSSRWPLLHAESISNDGRYFAYSVNIADRRAHFIVEATDLSWKKEIKDVRNAIFTSDSKRIVFRNGGDSLGIWELGSDIISYISGVVEFKVPESSGTYLVFRRKDSIAKLELLNLASGEIKLFSNVKDYFFNNTGRALILIKNVTEPTSKRCDVFWVDLGEGKTLTVCHGVEPSSFAFSKDGEELVFLTAVSERDDFIRASLWFFSGGMDSAQEIVGPNTKGMAGLGVIDDGVFFSENGKVLFFKLGRFSAEKGGIKPLNNPPHLTISGMHDFELETKTGRGSYLTSIRLDQLAAGVVRLQQGADRGLFWINSSGDYIVTESNIGGTGWEAAWNPGVRPDIDLVATRDGSHRLIGKGLLFNNMYLSPSGKFVIWFDQLQRNWFSYNTTLGRTINITSKINLPLYPDNEAPRGSQRGYKLAGWLANDEGILVYDRYDIWRVDPAGVEPPVNITHGYGREHRYSFRCINFGDDPSAPIQDCDTLLLSAEDLNTKKRGFFRLIVKTENLQALMMSAHIYNVRADLFCGVISSGPILKAKYVGKYVLPRMSANEYPNLYITEDFKDFRPLTDLHPQSEYNWYTTELTHWQLSDGSRGEGILFKPDDFNPKKKYPIIFYYYEQATSDLNVFIHPLLSDGPINIPWFVSHGYLVFAPDIHYKIGHPGQSACDAVVSAALFLAKKPWVDARKMGLQGHSYGGFETNYIVSHSKLFAAAAPASAVSDEISGYGQVNGTYYYENGQGRIGASLWKRPDLYFENSPIFAANKVSAAVLIMHTENDGGVPYLQGLQWYNALRHMGKKVWLLTYKGESHILGNENNQLDYSIRLAQFFDYYLKGAPPPIWMTKGVLADQMTIDDGLELDTSGRRP